MTRDELYIDDVLVDMGNTDISLNYKSNLLTDISKIVSNNSYTIKLPKTARNLKLIECADSPFSGTNFPYLNHSARLLRNGVEIVSDANVVLLGVDEHINVALSWGTGRNLQNLIKGDKKLTDLNYNVDSYEEYTIWKQVESYNVYPRIDYGFRPGEPGVWYHPVVDVLWLFGKISQDSGIVFDIPAAHQHVFKDMKIPLLTKNDAGNLIKRSEITLRADDVKSVSAGSYLYHAVSFYFPYDMQKTYSNHCGRFDTYTDPSLDPREMWTTTFVSKVTNARINVKGNVTIRVTSPNGAPDGLCFTLMMRKDNDLLSVAPDRVKLISGSMYEVSYYLDGQSDVLFTNNAYVDFALVGGPAGIVFQRQVTGSVTFSFQVDEVKLQTGNTNEGKFYFVPNLPEIKQIDFVKAIMQMTGLFAVTGEKNVIKLISFDTLLANKDKAVDWSDNVVKAHWSVNPKKIEYRVGNMAQVNHFRYKEDDKVRGNYDGEIIVNDNTIEADKDVVKLPFAACDERDMMAYIPLYSYNDKSELEYNKSAPRIVVKSGNICRFRGLDWNTLIRKYYQSYINIINRAKVIDERIKLSNIELKSIKMDIPVYLGQYGSYFAIIDIKTRENDIYDVKLLKI